MNDKHPIEELSDTRLREMAAKRQSDDLKTAHDKVSSLERALYEAKATHAKNFPRDDRVSNSKCMESLRGIDRIAGDLEWARRGLKLIESAADVRRATDAMESFKPLLKASKIRARQERICSVVRRPMSRAYANARVISVCGYLRTPSPTHPSDLETHPRPA